MGTIASAIFIGRIDDVANGVLVEAACIISRRGTIELISNIVVYAFIEQSGSGARIALVAQGDNIFDTTLVAQIDCIIGATAIERGNSHPVIQRAQRDLDRLSKRGTPDVGVMLAELDHEAPVRLGVGGTLAALYAAGVVHHEAECGGRQFGEPPRRSGLVLDARSSRRSCERRQVRDDCALELVGARATRSGRFDDLGDARHLEPERPGEGVGG